MYLNKYLRIIRNGVEVQLIYLLKVENIALHIILLVQHTTTIQIIQQQVATALIKYTINHLCKLKQLYLYKTKLQHLFYLRTKKANTSCKPTRLKKIAKICLVFTLVSNLLLKHKSLQLNLLKYGKNFIAIIGKVKDKEQVV